MDLKGQNWDKLKDGILTQVKFVANDDNMLDDEKNKIIKESLILGVNTIIKELKKYNFHYKKEIFLQKYVFYNPLSYFLCKEDLNIFYISMESKITETNNDLSIANQIKEYINKADILHNLNFVEQLLELLIFMFSQSFKRLNDSKINNNKIYYALRGYEYRSSDYIVLNEKEYKEELNNKLNLLTLEK